MRQVLRASVLGWCSPRCSRRRRRQRSPAPGTSTGVGLGVRAESGAEPRDESSTDQKDSDAAVPAAAYHDVTLTNLDGSGYLRGDYANIVSETGKPAFSPTNTFRYTRHQDEFEQVMAYYWITEAQKLHPAPRLRRHAAPDQQPSRRTCASTSGAPTTRSRPTIEERAALRQGRRRRRRGRGGDPARIRPRDPLRAELLVRFGEAGAISEGFGDYWAVTVSDVVSSRSASRASRCLRRRLGLDVVHERPCRTACAASTSTCTTRPTSTARCTTTARSGRARCGTSARRSATQGRHGHPAGLVRLPRHHDAGPRDRTVAGRARRSTAPPPRAPSTGVRRSRHPGRRRRLRHLRGPAGARCRPELATGASSLQRGLRERGRHHASLAACSVDGSRAQCDTGSPPRSASRTQRAAVLPVVSRATRGGGSDLKVTSGTRQTILDARDSRVCSAMASSRRFGRNGESPSDERPRARACRRL